MRGSLGGLTVAAAFAVAIGCSPAPAGTSNPTPSPHGSPQASGFAHEIRTPSGNATIGIPEGALPNGVSASDITINEPELPGEFADAIVAAFELGPDGTQFTQPVTLTVVVPWTEDASLLGIALVSGDAGELPDTSVTLDLAAGQATVSAPISHFSTAFLYVDNLRLQMETPAEKPVGVPFDVRVSYSRTTESVAQPLDETKGNAFERALAKASNALRFRETFGAVTVHNGHFYTNCCVAPRFKDNVPNVDPQGVSIETDTYTFTERFVCEEQGATKLEYSGLARQQVRTTEGAFFTHATGSRGLLPWFKSREINCTAALPSASSSPSPSPSTTPPGSGPTVNVSPLGVTLTTGQVLALNALAFTPDGATLDVRQDVTWRSSNQSVATVSNDAATRGQLTGVAPGQVNIDVSLEGSDPFYMLVNIVDPPSVDCPPEFSGSNQGMNVVSDPSDLSQGFGLEPATMGWDVEAANGEIHFSNGPAGFEEASGTFTDGCNFETEGLADVGGFTDVPFLIQGSAASGAMRVALIVGPNGELGAPPVIYAAGPP